MKFMRFRAKIGAREPIRLHGLSPQLRAAIRQEAKEALKREIGDLGLSHSAASPPRSDFSVEEVAQVLGKEEHTIREWCRLGRMRAFKRKAKHGGAERKWRIPADELARHQTEGRQPGVDPQPTN